MPERKLTSTEKRELLGRYTTGERPSELAEEYKLTARHVQRLIHTHVKAEKERIAMEKEDGYPFWASRGVLLPPIGDIQALREWIAKLLNELEENIPTPGTKYYADTMRSFFSSLAGNELLTERLLYRLRLDATRVVSARSLFDWKSLPDLETFYGHEISQRDVGLGTLNNKTQQRATEAMQTLIEEGCFFYTNGVLYTHEDEPNA